ncbi:ABC transporter permease [Xylanibacillus composti]|uniref:Transport permease protein n=1 Tax=Xylanibacillus composti TaxID=1572762 RepID=A0A8J4GYV3_9BACL|nr:ABC transporter permease [Xylanibacillus composti]MDT9725648.1 ABC transporter permease [Xylanibacillus composti]GIQ67742.1 transport permease protein [Xylanibacillus composti]
MKAYLQLTWAQLLVFSRNRAVIFFSLVFPILLMLALGSFLGTGGTVQVKGFLVDLDKTAASAALAAELHEHGLLDLKDADLLSEAEERVRQDQGDLIAIIPAGYGEELAKGTAARAEIQVRFDDTNSNAQSLGVQAVQQAADAASKQAVDYEAVILVEAAGIEGLDLRYIDFLVPGIVAMMIMNANLNGVAGQISAWRERGILRRMQSTTLKAWQFIAGQITARLLLNGSQALIVLLVGYLVFGTQVNGRWLELILFVILGTLTFMAIGFIIAGLAKNPESAGPIAGFISFPLLFLGGIFFPISNMPAWLQPIVQLIPISHLTTAMREIMNIGAGLATLWPEALLLSGWMVAAFVIASLTFRWE